MVTAVRTDQLNAALRLVLRADLSPVDRAAWPELLDIAARVVLAAEYDALRASLFGAITTEPAPVEGSTQAFIYAARIASVTVAGERTWTEAAHTREPLPAVPLPVTTIPAFPRRQGRGLSHSSFLLLTGGAVFALAGINLLFGPASDVVRTSSIGTSPELLGELSVLGGVAAWAWAAAQWAIARSFQTGDSDATVRPAGAMRWGLPLACSMVVMALGLSIVAAARPLKNSATQLPVAARQTTAVGLPAPLALAQTATGGGPTVDATASDPSLLRGSASLIRDVTRRVTTLARPLGSGPLTATSASTSLTQPAQSSDSPPANSTFTRVSDTVAGDSVETRPAPATNPAPGHIRLGPPPTPIATPRPTASAPPRVGPVVGHAPGLPPPAPTFPPGPTGTAVRH